MSKGKGLKPNLSLSLTENSQSVLKDDVCSVNLTDSSFLVNVSRHDPDFTLSRLGIKS